MAVFSYAQWVVDHDGIESGPADGRYFIAMDRVADITKRNNGIFYNWPIHLAEKEVVDMPFFLAAFEKALRLHTGMTGDPIDVAMLTASHIEAWRIWEKNRALTEIANRRPRPRRRSSDPEVAAAQERLGKHMPVSVEESKRWLDEDLRIYEEEQRLGRTFDPAMF